ncbi:hypothetical protein M513_11838 [Trichuris suis]|uniref:Uncharacterized protein n=1 Tax=Trichuris suis TaxID=68888 RepID=A0A085LQN9_9BILA|nr:hypothetical protein M513_11838 [Trichuris suis]
MAPKRAHPAKSHRAEETKRRKESDQPGGSVEANILFEYDHMMVVETERRGNRFAGIVLRMEENIHATPYGLSSYQFELLKDSLRNSSRPTANPQKVSSVVYRHADRLAESTRRTGETGNSESVAKQLSYEQLLRRNEELVDLVYRLRQLRYGSRPLSIAKRLRTVNSKKESSTPRKPEQEVPIAEKFTRKRAGRPSITRASSRISERIRRRTKEQLEEVEVQKKFVRGPSIGTIEHTIAIADAVKTSKTFHVESVDAVVSSDGLADSTELLERPLTRQRRSKETASKNLDSCLSTTPIIRRLAFLKANGEKLWCCIGKRRAGDVSANNAKRVRESSQTREQLRLEKITKVSNELALQQDFSHYDVMYMKGGSIWAMRREQSISASCTFSSCDLASSSSTLSIRVIAKKMSLRKPSQFEASEKTMFISNLIETSAKLFLESLSTVCVFHDCDGEVDVMALEAVPKSKITRSRFAVSTSGERKHCVCGNEKFGPLHSRKQLQRYARREFCEDVSPDFCSIQGCDSNQKIDNECLTSASSPTKTSKFKISSGFSRCVKFLSHSKRTCQYSITLLEKGFESTSAVIRERRVKLAKSFKNTTLISTECTLPTSRTFRNCAKFFVGDVYASPNLDRSIPGYPFPTLGAVEFVIPCKDSAQVSWKYTTNETDATAANDQYVSESGSPLSSSAIHKEEDGVKVIESQRATEKNELTCKYGVHLNGNKKQLRKFSDQISLLLPHASHSEHSSTALQKIESSSKRPDSVAKSMHSRGSKPHVQSFRQASEECSVLNTVPGKAFALASLTIRESRSDVVQSFEKPATSENVERGFAVRWAVDDQATSSAKKATGRMERIPYVFDRRSHSVRADHAYIKTPESKETVVASLTVRAENVSTTPALLDGSVHENFGSAEQVVFSNDSTRAFMVSARRNSDAEMVLDNGEQRQFRAVFRSEPFGFPLNPTALLPETLAEDSVSRELPLRVPRPEFKSSSHAVAPNGSMSQENATVNVAFDRQARGKTSSQFETATYIIPASDADAVSETVCKVDIATDFVYDWRFAGGTHVGFGDHRVSTSTGQRNSPIAAFFKRNAASNQVVDQPDCAKECFVPVTGSDNAIFGENVLVSEGVAPSEAAQVAVCGHSRKFELPAVFHMPGGLSSNELAESGTQCTSGVLSFSQLSSRDAEASRRAGILAHVERANTPCSKQQFLAGQSVEKGSNSLRGSAFRNVASTSEADVTNHGSPTGWQRNGAIAAIRANVESPIPPFPSLIRRWRSDFIGSNSPTRIVPYVIRLRPPGQSFRQDDIVVPSGETAGSSTLPLVEELIGTDRRLSGRIYRATLSPYIVHTNYSGKKC